MKKTFQFFAIWVMFPISFLSLTACGSDKNNKTEICNNSKDDDGDGLVDCRDQNCPPCGVDQTPPQPKVEICGNNTDDDGDGLVDCKDNNCPPCTEICDNNIDDDGDGLVDCRDTNSCPPCPNENGGASGPTPPPPPKFTYYDINLSGHVDILDNDKVYTPFGSVGSDTKCSNLPINRNVMIEVTASPREVLHFHECCGDEVVCDIYLEVVPSPDIYAVRIKGSITLFEGNDCGTTENEHQEKVEFVITPYVPNAKTFRLTHDCANCGDFAEGEYIVKLTPR